MLHFIINNFAYSAKGDSFYFRVRVDSKIMTMRNLP